MKSLKYISMGLIALALSACNDDYEQGTFEYEGSKNPENTSYHNPVWEPSLAGGTVFKSAANYIAISQETEWAKGLKYCAPTMPSSNLMKWTHNGGQAFVYDKGDVDEEGNPVPTANCRPATEGKLNKFSGDFCKTINGANHWLFYTAGENAIGAASATVGAGPYTDLGYFLTAEELGASTLKDPFFGCFTSVNYYLLYNTENGTYFQQLNLRKGQKPTKKGSAAKLAGADFTQPCLFRLDNNTWYLIGTVKTGAGSEIRYGKGKTAKGPFYDKNGTELTDGASNGELLAEGGTEYTAPENPMRLIKSDNGYFYLCYNATGIGREKMPSGYDRKPLFVNPVQTDEEGWFTSVIVPETGWTGPRFE